MHLRARATHQFGGEALKIAFIGGGNMGEAILAAVISRKLSLPEDIAVSDVKPERLTYLKEKYGVFVTGSNLEAASLGEVVILAVKPQQVDEVASLQEGMLHREQLAISIIAGKNLSILRKAFGHDAFVRAMPNTPAQIGRGMTVWTATENTTTTQRKSAEAILSVLGRAFFTPDEGVLDMATAISGSGPAYVFLFLESLIQAGEDIGLSSELAQLLAYETVLGAAEYARGAVKELAELRHNVTSPGGTTAAALKVLGDGGFASLIRHAVSAAYQRAQELGR